MKIIIDIGHARNTGSRGLNQFEEHAYCSKVAAKLLVALGKRGHLVDVIDYPNESNRADLNATIADINNRSGIDLVVSLHTNWAQQERARGAQVLYVSDSGKLAAGCIASHLSQLLPGRGDITDKRTDLAVLMRTKPTAVMVEMGFSTNYDDHHILTTCMDEVIAAIKQGIEDYATIIESQLNYNPES